MDRRKGLLVINAHARRGTVASGDLACQFAAHGLDVELVDAASTSCNKRIENARDEGFDLVVVGGGDGSINRALPGLLLAGVPLGILPLGTANDLARTLGIPPDMTEAVKVIAEGRIHRIDLGEVNGRAYVNVASIGVSVAVAQFLDPRLKKAFGPAAYVLGTLRALFDTRPFTARIGSKCGTSLVRSIQIAVGNGRHYGGGLTVHEAATVDDGRLHLYSIAPLPLWRYLLLAPAFRAGRHHRHPTVSALEGDEITIETSRPLSINADGEVTGRTPAKFRILPKILPVFVPASFAAATPNEAGHAAR